MDSLDTKALHLLMRTGRATWAELGQLLGLSAPSAAERVRKLEERGVIRGYAALVDPASVGHPLTAYISVSSPVIVTAPLSCEPSKKWTKWPNATTSPAMTTICSRSVAAALRTSITYWPKSLRKRWV